MPEVIVILTPGFPANEADTTCLPSLQVFVKALKKEYPAITVIVLAFQYPFTQTSYTWHNIRVIPLGGKNRGKLFRLTIWVKAWKTLLKLRKEYPITGLLSFWLGECALIGKWFGKKYRIKHFCWLLGQDARKGNWYYRFIKPKGEELVAISDSVKKEFYKNYTVSIGAVIPIGIDTTLFYTNKVVRDIDILGAGSLIPLKQYDIFIDIINEIRKTNPAVRAVLCGDGKEREKLCQLADDLQLSNNVFIAGELPHAAILQYMHRSKILLHPSSYEGFSTVCAEALQAGTQVISFCKPMEIDFPHWHIVSTKEEMLEKCMEVLENTNEYIAVTTCTIEETVDRIRNLFVS